MDKYNVPGYTFIKELGNGAQGAVYLMKDAKTGQSVAVKISFSLKSAWHELRGMIKFSNHPCVLQLIKHGKVGNVHYMVTELHQGDVYEWIAGLHDPRKKEAYKDKQQITDVLKLMWRNIGSVLNLMQSAGYVHRDIKPANMGFRVTEGKEVAIILCDFGLSRKIVDTSGNLLSPLARMYDHAMTPLYASPAALNNQDQFYVDDAAGLAMSMVVDVVLPAEEAVKQIYAPSRRAEFLRDPMGFIRRKIPNSKNFGMPLWAEQFISKVGVHTDADRKAPFPYHDFEDLKTARGVTIPIPPSIAAVEEVKNFRPAADGEVKAVRSTRVHDEIDYIEGSSPAKGADSPRAFVPAEEVKEEARPLRWEEEPVKAAPLRREEASVRPLRWEEEPVNENKKPSVRISNPRVGFLDIPRGSAIAVNPFALAFNPNPSGETPAWATPFGQAMLSALAKR